MNERRYWSACAFAGRWLSASARPHTLPASRSTGTGATKAVYLPHRYTYPLVAFSAVVVGVTIRPTWTALWARPRPRLQAFALLAAPLAIAGFAAHVFPLGANKSWERSWTTVAVAGGALVLAAAVALMLRRAPGRSVPALGAVLTGLTLLGLLVVSPDRLAGGRGSLCPTGPVIEYLASLPKDAVIAGDPKDMECLPVTARRAVVISTQLAPAYETDYFLAGRAREFATLRAYYGPSTDAIADLRRRYGATDLWVRRDAVRKELTPDGSRWRRRKKPYGQFVRQLVSSGEPAVLHLPAACRRWRHGSDEVYDIACVSRARRALRSHSPASS